MKKSIPNEILLPEVARLIKEGHTVTITVRGNSMNPFLVDRRDRVTLGDFTTEQLQPGVAVLARDLTERIVFHRIIVGTEIYSSCKATATSPRPKKPTSDG